MAQSALQGGVAVCWATQAADLLHTSNYTLAPVQEGSRGPLLIIATKGILGQTSTALARDGYSFNDVYGGGLAVIARRGLAFRAGSSALMLCYQLVWLHDAGSSALSHLKPPRYGLCSHFGHVFFVFTDLSLKDVAAAPCHLLWGLLSRPPGGGTFLMAREGAQCSPSTCTTAHLEKVVGTSLGC